MRMDQMVARACLVVEPLMIDLTSVPAIQNPSNPTIVCTTTMVVVTAATDGGLLSPLSKCVTLGAKAQKGNSHKRMRSTPARNLNRDR
jgi:hypothetical protein